MNGQYAITKAELDAIRVHKDDVLSIGIKGTIGDRFVINGIVIIYAEKLEDGIYKFKWKTVDEKPLTQRYLNALQKDGWLIYYNTIVL